MVIWGYYYWISPMIHSKSVFLLIFWSAKSKMHKTSNRYWWPNIRKYLAKIGKCNRHAKVIRDYLSLEKITNRLIFFLFVNILIVFLRMNKFPYITISVWYLMTFKKFAMQWARTYLIAKTPNDRYTLESVWFQRGTIRYSHLCPKNTNTRRARWVEWVPMSTREYHKVQEFLREQMFPYLPSFRWGHSLNTYWWRAMTLRLGFVCLFVWWYLFGFCFQILHTPPRSGQRNKVWKRLITHRKFVVLLCKCLSWLGHCSCLKA